jgi:hypothetical protein
MKHAIFASRTFPLSFLRRALCSSLPARQSRLRPSARSSLSGSDANPDCSRTPPCRTFKAAIAQTNPSGEVADSRHRRLRTDGHRQGDQTIGPSGVYGGISVMADRRTRTPPPTTGIVIMPAIST